MNDIQHIYKISFYSENIVLLYQTKLTDLCSDIKANPEKGKKIIADYASRMISEHRFEKADRVSIVVAENLGDKSKIELRANDLKL